MQDITYISLQVSPFACTECYYPVIKVMHKQKQLSVCKNGLSLPSLLFPSWVLPPKSNLESVERRELPQRVRRPTAKRFMVHLGMKIMPLVTQNQQSTTKSSMRVTNNLVKSWRVRTPSHSRIAAYVYDVCICIIT